VIGDEYAAKSEFRTIGFSFYFLIDFCGGGRCAGCTCNYLGGGDDSFFLIILAGSTFSLNL
jgi:hypothetical protein